MFEKFHTWHLGFWVLSNHCRNCFSKLGFLLVSCLGFVCLSSFGNALTIFLSWRKGVRYPLMNVLQLSFLFNFCCAGTGEMEGKTALPPTQLKVSPVCLTLVVYLSSHRFDLVSASGTKKLSHVAHAWKLEHPVLWRQLMRNQGAHMKIPDCSDKCCSKAEALFLGCI